MAESNKKIQVIHLYEKDVSKFESTLNSMLERLQNEGAEIVDIQYASDPATDANRTGGFSALVIHEA